MRVALTSEKETNGDVCKNESSLAHVKSCRYSLLSSRRTSGVVVLICACALAALSWRPDAGWVLPTRLPSSELKQSRLQRHARIDGPYGTMPETESPLVDLDDVEDPVWQKLVIAVQAADKLRAVDIVAFWTQGGYEMVVCMTALSRPQLQAIGIAINKEMKNQLRLRRKNAIMRGHTQLRAREMNIRDNAAGGWLLMRYDRIQINIFTPVQRSFYDIEGLWRDENEDYEEIDIQEILRREGFGNLRLRSFEDATGQGPPASQPAEDTTPANDEIDYEADKDDPFWK